MSESGDMSAAVGTGPVSPERFEPISFRVNEKPVVVRCPPERTLLSILREDFVLPAAKPGCEVGRCGACMVWLNDHPVNACLVMAWQLDGQAITTLEGLEFDSRCIPVRTALARSGAVQCGYCSAGMMMTLTWLYWKAPLISAADATSQMCGNLCRCTGYGGLQRAAAVLFGPCVEAQQHDEGVKGETAGSRCDDCSEGK
ncbi:2Fe-2S iron-sulfur cluster-binding protein [Caballeronia sp. LjRoot34]|jgi:carbon-monoxide dehydrogenase small subunit|uniref:(2Fe-2S)-binding protein n=1 Tax=Caballeronia sp. LjRoot34 TaxID=3342325 RepID=UPI003ECC8C1E